jgi:hypothetical protein
MIVLKRLIKLSINNSKNCNYCKQKLFPYDCTNQKQKNSFLLTLFDIWLFIETPFILLLMYLSGKSKEQNFVKKGTVYTCVNKDCIAYLKDLG